MNKDRFFLRMGTAIGINGALRQVAAQGNQGERSGMKQYVEAREIIEITGITNADEVLAHLGFRGAVEMHTNWAFDIDVSPRLKTGFCDCPNHLSDLSKKGIELVRIVALA